tara:strand:- start:10 stop:225 length:216 start_codon:yes stop_codon:yes gene_type:complete
MPVDFKVNDPEKKIMVESFLTLLEDNDFKKSFIKELNDAVDIPIVGEKQEGKIFKALYKVLIKTAKEQLLK